MAQIVLDRVSKCYGEEKALQNIVLEFEDHVTTAVVGPSGSGKSTLLQLMNGLVLPTEGMVHVFGNPIEYRHLTALRLKIGYAVQGGALFPHMSAWKNITLLARLNGWEPQRITARAEELMNLVKLPRELTRRYPHELSGGQQQRVALCRAMMLNPPIFLLDEPFGALDPMTRGDIYQEFLSLQRSAPTTIVLVTHNLREALKLAQRLVVLDRGHLVQHGTCEDILRHPANDFVRTLFQARLES